MLLLLLSGLSFVGEEKKDGKDNGSTEVPPKVIPTIEPDGSALEVFE